jgi:hypothetical protein
MSAGSSLGASWRELTSCLRRPRPAVLAALGLALALPLAFTFYTNLIWEDFFITYRYSENLARGLGLVYNPGERVQGFTSVFNTLIPAFFAWISGGKSFLFPLWCYRVVSLAGLGFGLVSVLSVFLRRADGSRAARLCALAFPVAVALEIKITAFTMSGQEAGFMVAFLGAGFALAYRDWERHALLGGALWAGLMYSRPDGFVSIGAIALTALAFAPGPRRPLFRSLLRSAGVCAALYLPWFLFTWAYYGTPVPHTVTAKYGVVEVTSKTFGLITPVADALQHAPRTLCYVFAPIYDTLVTGEGLWPKWIHDAGFVLAAVALLYWAVPSRDRFGRMASFLAFILFLYLSYVEEIAQFAPWYYPPLAFASLLALAGAGAGLLERVRSRALAAAAGAAGAAAVFGLVGYIFFASLYPIRIKQSLVEWGHRRMIGLYLKEHLAPGDTVYLEPLGYIGYFSQAHMLDWPGLVSPQVVATRRRLGQWTGWSWVPVAEALRPTWIVARIPDAQAMQSSEILSKNYVLMRMFDIREKVVAAGLVPGMNITFGESVFAVFRRADAGAAP